MGCVAAGLFGERGKTAQTRARQTKPPAAQAIDRAVSTAYCWSSSGADVDLLSGTISNEHRGC